MLLPVIHNNNAHNQQYNLLLSQLNMPTQKMGKINELNEMSFFMMQNGSAKYKSVGLLCLSTFFRVVCVSRTLNATNVLMNRITEHIFQRNYTWTINSQQQQSNSLKT